MNEVFAALKEILPPAAALICGGALWALRWRNNQCDEERKRAELALEKAHERLDAALKDAQNQREARIAEASTIVGEYRQHVEASTNAIERLEEKLDDR